MKPQGLYRFLGKVLYEVQTGVSSKRDLVLRLDHELVLDGGLAQRPQLLAVLLETNILSALRLFHLACD